MSQQPPESGPAEWFTVPGRLLFIATFLGCGALFYFSLTGVLTIPDLGPGSYPLILWIGPVAIFGLFFFVLVGFILERCGIKIYRRDRHHR